MKRYIHILLVALVLTACHKDDNYDGYRGPQYPEGSVQFTTGVKQTRASQTTSETMQSEGEKFQVAAYAQTSGGDYSQFFTTGVLYSNLAWGYDDTKFWPASGDLKFHAYSISKGNWWLIDANLADNFADADADVDDHAITYTTAAGIYNQGDLLVADTTASRSAKTTINFSHALSGVEFSVQFADEKNVYLDTLKIEHCGGKFVKTGSYNFADKDWTLGDSYFTSDDNTTVYPYYGSKQATTLGTVFNFGETSFFLPQPIANESYIEVTVNYYIVNENSEYIGTFDPEDPDNENSRGTYVSKSAKLPSLDGTGKFEKGHIYKYALTLNNNKISVGGIVVAEPVKKDETYGNIYLREIDEAILYNTSPLYDDAADVDQFAEYFNNTILPPNVPDTVRLDASKIAELKSSQHYYRTALRAQRLLNSGVRDFIIVGDYGASEHNNFGDDAKLGFWGGATSPFNIAIWTSDVLEFDAPEDFFSIDMRQVTGLPQFQHAHKSAAGSDITGAVVVANLDPTDPVIPSGAFFYVNNLREIILPTEVKAISEDAFAGCDNLVDIDIQNVIHLESGALVGCMALTHVYNGQLTRVHDYAAQNCVMLESINLSSTEEIDDYGFDNCPKLANVNFSSLRSVGAHAFSNCESLTLAAESTSPKLEGKVGDFAFSNCKYLGGVGEATFDLSAVTSVGFSSFINCAELELEPAMTQVETIGIYAFQGCAAIDDIDIANVKSVGDGAFHNCSSLTLQPNMADLTTIGSTSFQGCDALGEISIPALSSIGAYAFEGCENLKLVATEADGVTFKNDALTSIPEQTFANCSSLDSNLMLDNVESVGKYAFSGCANLQGISMDNLTTYGDHFLSWCSNLKSASFEKVAVNSVSYEESGVTRWISIPEMLHSSRGTLQSVDLSSITAIVDNGFSLFTELVSVDVASVLTIGNSGFEGCAKLTSISLPEVTSVGNNAFKDTGLTSLDLPKLTSMGNSILSGCHDSVKSVSMELLEDIGDLISGGNLIKATFEPWTLYDNNVLENLYLPNVKNALGWDACSYFKALKSVNLSSVASIGGEAFQNCTLLVDVNIESATSIGQSAFSGCTSLVTLDCASAASIDLYSFKNCTNLEEIYLPNVRTIRGYSNPFGACTSIKKLDLKSFEYFTDQEGNKAETWGSNCDVFNDVPSDCVIRLSQEQYDSADHTTNKWVGRTWGDILAPNESF